MDSSRLPPGEVSQLAAQPVKPSNAHKATLPAALPQHKRTEGIAVITTSLQQKRERARKRRDERHAWREQRKRKANQRERSKRMEGLIPFVIDVIRRSQERSGYRSVSSDGGSSRGGGSSRRHLIDYSELPDAAAAAANVVGVDRPSGALHRRAWSEYAETTVGRRSDEHARPAPVVVARPAYRRK